MAQENETIKVNANAVTIKPTEQKSVAPVITDDNMVKNAIIEKAKTQNDVKAVIDLAATSKALENEDTVKKLVKEKTDELNADAEAKRIKSETDKVREEVEKVKQEAEKEIAQIKKEKDALEADVERLKKLDDKAQAFFDANKSILRCVGVREKLSLKVMIMLMVPATILFCIFQVLLLPLSLIGFIIESVTGIVGSICGSISKNGWKIAIAIVSVALIAALVVGIYWLVATYAVKAF